MGNTWEVWSWESIGDGEYEYVLLYAGENRKKAMSIARKGQKGGAKCIKIMWRP